jgi:hypothetical protein
MKLASCGIELIDTDDLVPSCPEPRNYVCLNLVDQQSLLGNFEDQKLQPSLLIVIYLFSLGQMACRYLLASQVTTPPPSSPDCASRYYTGHNTGYPV